MKNILNKFIEDKKKSRHYMDTMSMEDKITYITKFVYEEKVKSNIKELFVHCLYLWGTYLFTQSIFLGCQVMGMNSQLANNIIVIVLFSLTLFLILKCIFRSVD